jgi:hypothetical protein
MSDDVIFDRRVEDAGLQQGLLLCACGWQCYAVCAMSFACFTDSLLNACLFACCHLWMQGCIISWQKGTHSAFLGENVTRLPDGSKGMPPWM